MTNWPWKIWELVLISLMHRTSLILKEWFPPITTAFGRLMTLEPITNPWFLSFQVTRLLSSDGPHSLVFPLMFCFWGMGVRGRALLSKWLMPHQWLSQFCCFYDPKVKRDINPSSSYELLTPSPEELGVTSPRSGPWLFMRHHPESPPHSGSYKWPYSDLRFKHRFPAS